MRFKILKVTEKNLPDGMKKKRYTGESGSSCNGAIGMRQMLGVERSKSEEKIQQDAMSAGFLKDLPRDESKVSDYFEAQAISLNEKLKAMKFQFPTGGSTRTSAVIDTRTRTLWSNNMGDGVIFLVTQDVKGEIKVKQINKLDKPTDDEERLRLEKEKIELTYEEPFNGLHALYHKLNRVRIGEAQKLTLKEDEFKKLEVYQSWLDEIYWKLDNYAGWEVDYTNVLDIMKLIQDIFDLLKPPLRLNGELAVSAGYGDYEIKGVRRTPKVTKEEIPSTGKSWLVMGSDGLLEKYGDDETSEFIRSTFQRKSNASSEILADALITGACVVDNGSVYVAMLHSDAQGDPKLPEGTVIELNICDGHGKKGEVVSKAIADIRKREFCSEQESRQRSVKGAESLETKNHSPVKDKVISQSVRNSVLREGKSLDFEVAHPEEATKVANAQGNRENIKIISTEIMRDPMQDRLVSPKISEIKQEKQDQAQHALLTKLYLVISKYEELNRSDGTQKQLRMKVMERLLSKVEELISKEQTDEEFKKFLTIEVRLAINCIKADHYGQWFSSITSSELANLFEKFLIDNQLNNTNTVHEEKTTNAKPNSARDVKSVVKSYIAKIRSDYVKIITEEKLGICSRFFGNYSHHQNLIQLESLHKKMEEIFKNNTTTDVKKFELCYFEVQSAINNIKNAPEGIQKMLSQCQNYLENFAPLKEEEQVTGIFGRLGM